MHSSPSELAGATVLVDIGQGIQSYDVEDYWDRVSGGSWMFADGNPAALNYAMRTAGRTPLDDEVLYGKIDGLGYLVHVSEVKAYVMAMNPEIKAQWVAALRSGDYAQTKGTLAQQTPEGMSYCCLGVLCELAANEGKVSRGPSTALYSSTGSMMISLTYDAESGTLPVSVREWSGLIQMGGHNPITNERGGVTGTPQSLAELNDAGRTFAEIAAIIERDL